MPSNKKTAMTYFDPAWVSTEDDGAKSRRTPVCGPSAGLGFDQPGQGPLQEAEGVDPAPSTIVYDSNGNVVALQPGHDALHE